MATSAQYATAPGYSTATVTTAETSFTPATTNLAVLLTGTSTAAGTGVGYRINRIWLVGRGTVNGGTVRFWSSTDGGTTLVFLGDVQHTGVTAATTAESFKMDVPFLANVTIPGSTAGNAFRIYMGTSVTNTIVGHVWYGAL
jgi:hypothetical protein